MDDASATLVLTKADQDDRRGIRWPEDQRERILQAVLTLMPTYAGGNDGIWAAVKGFAAGGRAEMEERLMRWRGDRGLVGDVTGTWKFEEAPKPPKPPEPEIMQGFDDVEVVYG